MGHETATTLEAELGESLLAALLHGEGTDLKASVDGWRTEYENELAELFNRTLTIMLDKLVEAMASSSSQAKERSKRDEQFTRIQLQMKLTHAGADGTPMIRRSESTEPKSETIGDVDDDWDDEYDSGDRTPNDDRSDSMNPNNDAYWSSRQ